MSEDLDLGRLLGRREAFQLVAARCSAADAASMREIRDRKLWVGHAADWSEFCVKRLHTSKENANRIIRQLDEFGPTYFEIAQMTPISSAAYRAIAPAVQDRKLLHNGEAIEIVPENAEKIVAAVVELRKAAKPAPLPGDPFPSLDRRCHDLVEELTALIGERRHKRRLQGTLGYLRSALQQLELTL
jgi:hypothetical protein